MDADSVPGAGLADGHLRPSPRGCPPVTVCSVFGTRPEAIKLGPVIRQLEAAGGFRTVNVSSGQHADLLYPFARLFDIRIDHDLGVMEPGQTPAEVCARVLAALDPVLSRERPDLVVVQGDTTTALAGALAGYYRGIPVCHVEAGLRSGDSLSPFPEEAHRRLISRLATYHCAATPGNRRTLLAEGVPAEAIAVTGNPVVDALHAFAAAAEPGPALRRRLDASTGLKRLVVTLHRRESFGDRLAGYLHALRAFVERNADVALFLPVHPNPAVCGPTRSILAGVPRVHLLEPLPYPEMVALMAAAWLIASDSGGIQEEAPSLGKPLLVLRGNTERPEVLDVGVARLVGTDPDRLGTMLEEACADAGWVGRVGRTANPFGQGDSGRRIAQALAAWLGLSVPPPETGGRAGGNRHVTPIHSSPGSAELRLPG